MSLFDFLQMMGFAKDEVLHIIRIGIPCLCVGSATSYLKYKYGRFYKYTQQGVTVLLDRENNKEYISVDNKHFL